VLSDRLAIASQGNQNVVLSPMALVACDTEVRQRVYGYIADFVTLRFAQHDMGCNGGWPEYAANYLVETGIPTDECEPYDLTQQRWGCVMYSILIISNIPPNSCPAACVDGSPKKMFKYSSWRWAQLPALCCAMALTSAVTLHALPALSLCNIIAQLRHRRSSHDGRLGQPGPPRRHYRSLR
jgi:hypothetical protein